jgi:hypothetical protein
LTLDVVVVVVVVVAGTGTGGKVVVNEPKLMVLAAVLLTDVEDAQQMGQQQTSLSLECMMKRQST